MDNQDNPTNKLTIKNASVLTGNNMEAVLDKMAADMKFFAIFYIIYGGMMSLTIVGAIIGIPMIIYNIKLKNSAQQFRSFGVTKDFFLLNKAFENQQKFFFFNKVLIIISLVFFVLYIAAIIIFGLSAFFNPVDSAFA